MLVTFSNFLSEHKFKIFIIRTSNNLSHSIFFFNKLLSHDLKIDLIVLINFKCFLFSLWLQVLLKWYFNSLWFFLAITLKIESWKRIWIKIHSPFRLNFMFLSFINLSWLLIYLILVLIRVVLIVWNTNWRLYLIINIWIIDWVHLHWFLIRNFFRIWNLIWLLLKSHMICIFLTIFIQILICQFLSIFGNFELLLILYLILTIGKLNWLLLILVQAWRISLTTNLILPLIIIFLIWNIWVILILILLHIILVWIWKIWGILILMLIILVWIWKIWCILIMMLIILVWIWKIWGIFILMLIILV